MDGNGPYSRQESNNYSKATVHNIYTVWMPWCNSFRQRYWILQSTQWGTFLLLRRWTSSDSSLSPRSKWFVNFTYLFPWYFFSLFQLYHFNFLLLIISIFLLFTDFLLLLRGMIEHLNRMMTQCLCACIDEQKDWIIVLQSIAMSYRSTCHESTGKSPYEVMFGCTMRLPFELKTNPFTGIPKHVHNDDLGEIFPEDSEQEIVDKFNTIDKIRGVIHNAASDEIARSQLKQAKYYDSGHCGSKLSVGDKVLHYNHKAAQWQGDKTAPKWIGPYTIVKVHDKGNYTVKDKNGKQLATKVCTSNLKLWQEPIASDFLPDWIKPSQIPDSVDEVKEQLDRSKKEKKMKKKKEQKRKLNQICTWKNCTVKTFLLLLVNVKILSNTLLPMSSSMSETNLLTHLQLTKKSTFLTTYRSTHSPTIKVTHTLRPQRIIYLVVRGLYGDQVSERDSRKWNLKLLHHKPHPRVPTIFNQMFPKLKVRRTRSPWALCRAVVT